LDISIAVNADDEEDDENQFQTSKQKFLSSFSAPKKILQETFDQNEADEDVFKDYRRKTIAEKESEYQAKWRKRAKVSPPRFDPYSKATVDSTHNSYRDIMIDVNLEKERADVIRKIEQQQRQEKEEKQKEQRKQERLHKEEQKRLKKEKKRRSRSKSRSESDSESPKKDKKVAKLSSWETEEEDKWSLEVIKNGAKMESLFLEPDIAYTLGRGDAEIKLEHGSCSKNHAKITFMDGRPNIMDLNSTNGTFLNEEQLVPGQWYKLSEKDILKFACSTREYRVHCG